MPRPSCASNTRKRPIRRSPAKAACVGFARGGYFTVANAEGQDAGQGVRAHVGRAHRGGLEPGVAGRQAGDLYEPLHLCAALGALPAGDEDAVPAHPRHADRGGDRARREKKSSPTSTAASRCSSTGTARARRTTQLVLGARGAELGGAQLRHLVSCRASARRSWSRSSRAIPTGRWSSARSTTPSRWCRSRCRPTRRRAGCARIRRWAAARRTATSSASRTRRGRSRSPCTRRRTSTTRDRARRDALGGARRDHHDRQQPHRDGARQRDDHHRQEPHRDGAHERDGEHRHEPDAHRAAERDADGRRGARAHGGCGGGDHCRGGADHHRGCCAGHDGRGVAVDRRGG